MCAIAPVLVRRGGLFADFRTVFYICHVYKYRYVAVKTYLSAITLGFDAFEYTHILITNI